MIDLKQISSRRSVRRLRLPPIDQNDTERFSWADFGIEDAARDAAFTVSGLTLSLVGTGTASLSGEVATSFVAYGLEVCAGLQDANRLELFRTPMVNVVPGRAAPGSAAQGALAASPLPFDHALLFPQYMYPYIVEAVLYYAVIY